jgi:hypothetical protein
MSNSASTIGTPVKVKATETVGREPHQFTSERLLMRSLLNSDFPAWHTSWQEEDTIANAGLEAMTHGNFARIWFNRTRKGWAKVGNFRFTNQAGTFIGEGGVYHVLNHWPEVFQLVEEKYPGEGFSAEFLEAFTDVWWRLRRTKINELSVELTYLNSDERGATVGRLCAPIKLENTKSHDVVMKARFNKKKVIEKDGEQPIF